VTNEEHPDRKPGIYYWDGKEWSVIAPESALNSEDEPTIDRRASAAVLTEFKNAEQARAAEDPPAKPKKRLGRAKGK
jgi:hypothetical protein